MFEHKTAMYRAPAALSAPSPAACHRGHRGMLSRALPPPLVWCIYSLGGVGGSIRERPGMGWGSEPQSTQKLGPTRFMGKITDSGLTNKTR